MAGTAAQAEHGMNPGNALAADDIFNHALAQLRSGRFSEALPALTDLVARDPGHYDALNALAQVALQRGEFDSGADYAGRALALRPADPMAHVLLGRLRKGQERLAEAEASYRRALALRPEFPEALVSLGIVLRMQNRPGEAAECYREALRQRPRYAEAQVNLANVLRQMGQVSRANQLYKAAAIKAPDLAEARSGLAASLMLAGKREEAVEGYRRALALKPDQPRLHFVLGCLLTDLGQEGALDAFYQATQWKPDFADAWSNLGISLMVAGRKRESLSCYERAVKADSRHLEGHINLAMAVGELGDTRQAEELMRHMVEVYPEDTLVRAKLGLTLMWRRKLVEAVPLLREAVAAEPNDPSHLVHLASALQGPGLQREANELFRRAVALDPTDLTAHSNLLLGLAYADGVTMEELHAAAVHVSQQPAAQPPKPKAPVNPAPDPERKLRIGYVSPDLHKHSVAYFFAAVAEHYDRSAFEVFCYFNHVAEDEVSARLRAQVDHWTNVYGTTEEQLAEQVRADGIDILVDVAGHTAHHRLPAFAMQPAPVQMTWLGFPGTVGIPAIAYRVTDWKVDPPGYERYNTETPLRLPGSYFCYRPGPSPEVGPLPALAAGSITFGSFNNLSKVSTTAVELWAAVLKAVPGSRLLLKTTALAEPEARAQLVGVLASLGVDETRVELLGWADRIESHLDIYNRVDIALDTLPYNGATTTCEALWMGVPVVSLAGETHASRMGLSILSAAGLPDLVADSPEAYVRRAAELASDLPRLAALRAGLREQLSQSALMDEPRYTRGLERLYQEVWRAHCTTQSGAKQGGAVQNAQLSMQPSTQMNGAGHADAPGRGATAHTHAAAQTLSA
jgi:predicted O-linked N-acetylglucosamine transferase (SPINDLY family)